MFWSCKNLQKIKISISVSFIVYIKTTKYRTPREMSKRITPNKLTKSCNIEQLAESRHTSDLVQTFSKENGGLNQVLQRGKPPTYMTAISTSSSLTL